MRQAHPNSRNTDPVTSHLAGEELETSGKGETYRTLTKTAVEAHPGLTARELAIASGLPHEMLHKRLPEVSAVEKGEYRTCSVSKRKCATWFPRGN